MNDTHSHLEPAETELRFDGVKTWADLGGFAKVASKVKVRQEKPDSILLHAGDAVQGTVLFHEIQW